MNNTVTPHRFNGRCLMWTGMAIVEDFIAASSFTTGNILMGATFLALSADSVRQATRAYYAPGLR